MKGDVLKIQGRKWPPISCEGCTSGSAMYALEESGGEFTLLCNLCAAVERGLPISSGPDKIVTSRQVFPHDDIEMDFEDETEDEEEGVVY